MRDGCAVPSAELHSQLGCLLEFRDISVDEDGNIVLKLQMKASGGTVDLNLCIQANSKRCENIARRIRRGMCYKAELL